jgi:hypothetical protein
MSTTSSARMSLIRTSGLTEDFGGYGILSVAVSSITLARRDVTS